MSDPIRDRFARDTKHHAMTVLHDDGLYRHLRFMDEQWKPPLARPQRSSMYWFELVTVPGTLIFNGDGESYTFRRTDDMFEFFRGPVGRINPDYWGEKVTSGREHLTEYDEDAFRAEVNTVLAEAIESGTAPAGLAEAVRREVLDSGDIYYEVGARQVLDYFEHDGFQFYDTYEWNLQRPKWWFLWSLHAIVWGIAQYDQHHGRAISRHGLTVPAAAPKVVTEGVKGGVL